MAHAQEAFAPSAEPLPLFAGPDDSYPMVDQLPPGAPLTMFGCLNDWSWCDVGYAGARGWAYGPSITYLYQGTSVPFYTYAPTLSIPVIGFALGAYWDRYYRGRPWYQDRDQWIRRPPPERVAPPRPQMGRPLPDRPGFEPDRPGFQPDVNHPGASFGQPEPPSDRGPEVNRPGTVGRPSDVGHPQSPPGNPPGPGAGQRPNPPPDAAPGNHPGGPGAERPNARPGGPGGHPGPGGPPGGGQRPRGEQPPRGPS
jgi:uncharacterized protein YraI